MSNASKPLVIVISAWIDDATIRARLVYGDNGAPRTSVCRSVEDIVREIQKILAEWDEDAQGSRHVR